MRITVVLLISIILITSCNNPSQSDPAATEVVEQQSMIPSNVPATSTPTPTSTVTPEPTKTLKPTQTQTPTFTSTPTSISTPEGVTELGYFLWDVSNSTGLEVQTGLARDIRAMGVWPFWLYIEKHWSYIYGFTSGYSVDEQADTFLVVSRVIKDKNWKEIGLGFSIYRGHIFSDCQGTILPTRRPNVIQCMAFEHDRELFTGDIEYMYKQAGIWYIPDRVYPLDTEQVKTFETKYSLKDYPDEFTVYGTIGPTK